MKKQYSALMHCAAIFVALCLYASPIFAQEEDDLEGKQSYSITDHRFSDWTGPVSEKPEEDQGIIVEDIPQNTRTSNPTAWQPAITGECNSCAGSRFIESFSAQPTSMRGIWSQPDCGVSENILVHTEYFSLWHGGAEVLCLEPIIAVEDLGRFQMVKSPTGQTFVEITNDGLMRTAVPEDTSRKNLEAIKTKNIEIEKAARFMGHEYASCAFYPRKKKGLTQNILEYVEDLDDLVKACYSGETYKILPENPKCSAHLFDYFDEDRSKSWDNIELSKAVFYGYMTHDLMNQCITSISYQRKRQADVLNMTNFLLGRLDANKDYRIDFDELKAFSAQLNDMEVIDRMSILTLQDLFPFFSDAQAIDPNLIKEAIEFIK